MSRFLLSLKNNKWGILLILVASIFTSVGQLLWKLSGGSFNSFLILGFALYFLGAVCMIASFRFGSLSVLHPLLSFGYVFASVFGVVYLNEALTIHKTIGTAVIIIGAVLVGGGDD